MRLCLYGCERPALGTTGFCGEAHNLAYCTRALDSKLKTASGMGSVMGKVFEAKEEVLARRKRWKEENPGKIWRAS